MKYILFIALFAAAFTACKKGHPPVDQPPPPQRTAVVSTFAGDGTDAYLYPAGLAIDADGRLYVADAMNNRVRKISFK